MLDAPTTVIVIKRLDSIRLPSTAKQILLQEIRVSEIDITPMSDHDLIYMAYYIIWKQNEYATRISQ